MFPARAMPGACVAIVQLKEASGKLNENQRKIVETLAASGGRVPADDLRSLDVPQSTLATLARRGIVEILSEPMEFTLSGFEAKPALDFPAQPGADEGSRRDPQTG